MEFLLRPVVGSAVGWPQAVCMSWPGRAWTWSTCCRRAGAPRVRLGARCGPARRPGRGRLLGAAPVSGPGHGSGLPRARAARLPRRITRTGVVLGTTGAVRSLRVLPSELDTELSRAVDEAAALKGSKVGIGDRHLWMGVTSLQRCREPIYLSSLSWGVNCG